MQKFLAPDGDLCQCVMCPCLEDVARPDVRLCGWCASHGFYSKIDISVKEN